MLNTIDYEAPGGVQLLIAHGLFGSAKNWGSMARRFAEARPVRVVDMRNHGESFHHDRHDYEALADDLAGVIEGQVDVLGHSMGGKAAMILALTRPELVRKLVVADIAPVAYSHSQAHLIEAMRAVDLSALSSRSDADRALAAHIEDRGVRAFLLQSLDRREGKWRLNLDTLEREMPKIVGWPAISGSYEGPALFLAGADSDYVEVEHRDRIKALFPASMIVRVPGAGHWLHADAPDAVFETVSTFLNA